MIRTPRKVSIWEDGSLPVYALVKDSTGIAATQASFSAITYTITNTADGTTVNSGTLTIASVISNTVLTTALEQDNVEGRNFTNVFAASNFATPGTYQVEVKFTFTDAFVDWAVYECSVVSVYAS